MAVEESELNNNILKKIMLEEYNIFVSKIKKINRGSANVFEMMSESGHLILKEFQSTVDLERIENEYLILKHLKNKSISAPEYILTKDEKFFYKNNNKYIIVQKYIDGSTISFNKASSEMIIDSAQMYGKIVNSLESFQYELPTFTRHFLTKESCEKDINNIDILLKINKNNSVHDALFHKKTLLLKLEETDYSWKDKITYKNSHGDYNISQFIYNDKGKIKSVVDWVSARNIPVARELIRNYFFMAKEIKKQQINFDLFIKYIKEYEKYQELNYYDLKYMPLIYLTELARTIFGFEQYIHSNSAEYLKYGNELYNQCVLIEKYMEELSNKLIELNK